MKKLIFTIALAIAGIALHAQVYVNGKNLTELSTGPYMEIESRRVQGTNDFNIVVNYGQEVRNTKNLDLLTDKEGTALKFTNMIGALNYLDGQGWAYADFIPLSSDLFGGKYLIKRK